MEYLIRNSINRINITILECKSTYMSIENTETGGINITILECKLNYVVYYHVTLLKY